MSAATASKAIFIVALAQRWGDEQADVERIRDADEKSSDYRTASGIAHVGGNAIRAIVNGIATRTSAAMAGVAAVPSSILIPALMALLCECGD